MTKPSPTLRLTPDQQRLLRYMFKHGKSQTYSLIGLNDFNLGSLRSLISWRLIREMGLQGSPVQLTGAGVVYAEELEDEALSNKQEDRK